MVMFIETLTFTYGAPGGRIPWAQETMTSFSLDELEIFHWQDGYSDGGSAVVFSDEDQTDANW